MASGIPATQLEEVVVTARRLNTFSPALSASAGTVFARQIEHRPILRTAELLEVIPGLIVTQHSGDGKANQYFLRGFNLDHGTDFATYVDGMPVNMPTHGHGQGYSDLNFFIPELVDRLDYRKGTYFADQGNFSAAGAVAIRYKRRVDAPFLTLTAGEDSFSRAVAGMSPEIAEGDLLVAADHQRTNGPWRLDENLRKTNVLTKFSRGTPEQGWDASFMAYDGRWRSTDQIPLRAVESGAIDRFGVIDPGDGGKSHRYSLSAHAWGALGSGAWRALAYGIDYDLALYSNFTYFTDPVNGDQFEQVDDRRVFGGEWRYEQSFEFQGRAMRFESGLQVRRDDIGKVGLYKTIARRRVDTVREDAVVQESYAAFTDFDVQWTPWLKTQIGARADFYDFDVRSSLPINSGKDSDSIVSPKFTAVLGPWNQTEFFVNIGRGFHSNDARGTTMRVDPNDGTTPAERVDPLVRAKGSEIGIATRLIPKLHLAASLWQLNLDSELLFVGDGGTTEASRPTKRRGVELGLYYASADWVIIDTDLAWSRPRFDDDDPAGSRIPGAIERVASLGIVLEHPSRWFGGARVRHLGSAALIEDGSARSKPTTLVNLETGYRFSEQLSVQLSILNLFDEEANDITYLYESQLTGETAPVTDIHFYPVEPRTVRVGIEIRL